MIENFEDYTYDLTDMELKSISKVISCFENPSLPTTAKEIVKVLSEKKDIEFKPHRVRQILSKVRKLKVRWKGKQLIGTSRGYYWTNNPDEIYKYKRSLEQRMVSMNNLIDNIN